MLLTLTVILVGYRSGSLTDNVSSKETETEQETEDEAGVKAEEPATQRIL